MSLAGLTLLLAAVALRISAELLSSYFMPLIAAAAVAWSAAWLIWGFTILARRTAASTGA